MRLWWRLRSHGPLFVIAWERGGYAYRCVLCGRAGVEVELPVR